MSIFKKRTRENSGFSAPNSDKQFTQILAALEEIRLCVKNSSDSETIKTWQLLCHDYADDIHLLQQCHNLYAEKLLEALSNGGKPYDGGSFIGADPNEVECFRLGNPIWMIIEENLNKICNIQKEIACRTNQK